MEDVLSGFQMQLLLYLKAVSSDYKPAGVFYFKIAEPHVEDKGKGDVAEEIRKQFRLDGISLKDPAVETAIGQGAKTMEPADFEAMQETVSGLIKGLCGRLLSGDVAARPMTAKNIKGANNRPMTACTYCNYRSVCSYDLLFE
jgi:ATP-dependent helicase/DNAse subunit B